jgi:hypothetical protein
MQTTCFKQLMQMARQAGFSVEELPLVGALPDTMTHLGLPLDPQMAALLQVADGCWITWGGARLIIRGSTLIEDNLNMRILRDDIAFLSDVMEVADIFGSLVTVPRLANADGVQPVCRLDDHEDGYLEPIASSLNRALMLYMEYEIRTADVWKYDVGVPFPEGAIQDIVADAALMKLVYAGAFDDLDGGTSESREWLEALRDAGRARTW